MSGCRPLRPEEIHEVAQSFVGLSTGFRITELFSVYWHDCVRHGQVTEALCVERRHMQQKQRGRTIALRPEARAALARWYEGGQPPTGTLHVFRFRKGINRPLTR
jgi:hypothetical protein